MHLNGVRIDPIDGGKRVVFDLAPTPNHTPPNPNKHNTTTGVSKTQHHTPKPRRELGCTQSELHKEKPNGQKTPPIHWSVVSPGG